MTLSPVQPGPTSHTPARKLFQYQCSESDSPCGKQTTTNLMWRREEKRDKTRQGLLTVIHFERIHSHLCVSEALDAKH